MDVHTTHKHNTTAGCLERQTHPCQPSLANERLSYPSSSSALARHDQPSVVWAAQVGAYVGRPQVTKGQTDARIQQAFFAVALILIKRGPKLGIVRLVTFVGPPLFPGREGRRREKREKSLASREKTGAARGIQASSSWPCALLSRAVSLGARAWQGERSDAMSQPWYVSRTRTGQLRKVVRWIQPALSPLGSSFSSSNSKSLSTGRSRVPRSELLCTRNLKL